jgi:hypothetical protein
MNFSSDTIQTHRDCGLTRAKNFKASLFVALIFVLFTFFYTFEVQRVHRTNENVSFRNDENLDHLRNIPVGVER